MISIGVMLWQAALNALAAFAGGGVYLTDELGAILTDESGNQLTDG